MKTPFVSVVIPVYNRSSYLLKAVESVLAQTWADFELLIIDDASTDDTLKTARAVASKDDRIIVIQNTGRHGPGGARNAGLKQARGEWVAFLDSDDVWLPHALEKFCAAAAPDVALIGSDFLMVQTDSDQSYSSKEFVMTTMLSWWSSDRFASKVIDCDSLKAGTSSFSDPRQLQLMTLGNYLWVSTSAVMVRLDHVKKVGGFSDKLLRTEDLGLWLKIIELGRVVFIDDILMRCESGGRSDGISDRYKSYSKKRCHSAYSEACFHLAFIQSLPGRITLDEAGRAFWRERVAALHKICGFHALEEKSSKCLWHYGRALIFSAEQRRILRNMGGRYFKQPW